MGYTGGFGQCLSHLVLTVDWQKGEIWCILSDKETRRYRVDRADQVEIVQKKLGKGRLHIVLAVSHFEMTKLIIHKWPQLELEVDNAGLS